jgi:hypothetical protein
LRRAIGWLAGLTLLLATLPVSAEVIELFPGGSDHFGMRNVFAPFGSIFTGPGHWYGERKIEVTTTPPDAMVDLFYVRAGFQKRFEQADAPVTILLPKRINANPKDVVVVRAFAEGYRVVETTVKVKSRTDEVHLEMAPLPNLLEAVAHTYLAGRSSLTFYTKEALTLRLQDRKGGFSAALNETAKAEGLGDRLEELRSPLVSRVVATQLGEDLVVQVTLGSSADGGEPELRSRQGRDPIRDLHLYTVDIVAPGANTEGIQQAKDALAQIRTADVSGCAARLDDGLREAVGIQALSRALTPKGRFIDPYLRAAMRRLGEVSPGGTVALVDGTRYDTKVPLQLAAAENDAANAKGYLALLRRFVALLEPENQRSDVLRGLLAPEMTRADFTAALSRAETAEQTCIASR